MTIRLIRKVARAQQRIVGQQSDGSDHVLEPYTDWLVEVTDGVRVLAEVFNHDPSDEEIAELFPLETDLDPTSAAQWQRAIRARFELWQMVKIIHAEAIARGVPASYLAKLAAAEDATWTKVGNAVVAWMDAP